MLVMMGMIFEIMSQEPDPRCREEVRWVVSWT